MVRNSRRNVAARSRELGAELRRARLTGKLTARQLSRKLGCSESKVSRMETGDRGASEFDVTTFLAHCGSSQREIRRVVEIARESNDSYRIRKHSEQLPDELRSLIAQETTADAISIYEPMVIPGLLQTEDYARALFGQAGLIPADDLEARVAARIERQSILRRRNAPEFTFFVHEQALRSDIGGRQVMHEQALHLVLNSGRARCTVRVLPDSAMPCGLFGGGFRVMRYAGNTPLAYLEHQTASLFLEDPTDISVYSNILRKLAADALDEGQSREWLATLASEYDQPEDAPQ
ncbi:transcriptional regulator [Amycolatopsis antarctica]|uniref:Transcriptional regulator n=1 Tax=Amycolatopsis antarctica TaxID=1854586 RepID=A0A263D5P6_9PSEU|nr:helix-turn-helix transcriptional regulator [Amycolatopsis antarctica]OZM72796.1 transcriptional regulator [Amycolatopsis antarctica]